MAMKEAELLRRHTRPGRPLGKSAFADRIERTSHQIARPTKPGRKAKRLEK